MTNNLQQWKVTKSRIVHQTRWIEVKEEECQSGDKTFIYTYTKRIDEGPVIIPEETNGDIWLVQQYRHPIKKVVWQFPVEGKEEGESWEEAAKRGLAEELNYTASEWQNLGEYYPDPGGLEQKYQVFLATGLTQLRNRVEHDQTEELRAKRFTRSQIEQMIMEGEVCDNWTLAGLYLLDRHKILKKG